MKDILDTIGRRNTITDVDGPARRIRRRVRNDATKRGGSSHRDAETAISVRDYIPSFRKYILAELAREKEDGRAIRVQEFAADRTRTFRLRQSSRGLLLSSTAVHHQLCQVHLSRAYTRVT